MGRKASKGVRNRCIIFQHGRQPPSENCEIYHHRYGSEEAMGSETSVRFSNNMWSKRRELQIAAS